MSTEHDGPERPPLQIAAMRPLGSLENCLLVVCDRTRRAAAIDPGHAGRQLIETAEQLGVVIEKIVLTNGHVDAAGAARGLADQLGIRIEGPHERDRALMARLDEEGQTWDVAAEPLRSDRWVCEGDIVTIGAIEFHVYETPGHTAGGVVYHSPAARLALVGGILAKGSVGRIDIPGGDGPQLMQSITAKLWPLGRETTLFPAYGDPTTIGVERADNPILGDAVLAAYPGVMLPA